MTLWLRLPEAFAQYAGDRRERRHGFLANASRKHPKAGLGKAGLGDARLADSGLSGDQDEAAVARF